MVTGRGALFLCDAVAAHQKIKSVCMHHEQAAAFAAVAYSDCTENLGACLISTGCASTNALTGVLNAWQDGIPCIFISGQNKLNETTRYSGIPIRTYGQQEADIISIVKPITKYASMVSDPNSVVQKLNKALHLALEGRKGPVWLDIPLDVQNKRIDPKNHKVSNMVLTKQYLPNEKDLKYIVDSLKKSERPCFLIGSGVRSANAIKELELFVEKFSMPVVYSNSSPDAYGLSNNLSIGSVGIMGCTRSGNFTIQNSDLVIVLGNRLSPMTTDSDCTKFARSAKIIVIDIDEIEHKKEIIKIDKLIFGDVKEVLKKLLKIKNYVVDSEWVKTTNKWKKNLPSLIDNGKEDNKVDLYELSETFSEVLPDNCAFITDSGLIELIMPTNIRFRRTQRCIHPSSQGSMGFALPGIVGSHFAYDQVVVSVVGDGSIMMNLQELQTIIYYDIPAKIFVINNNVYAVIRKRQKDLFRSRSIGVDPSDGVSCPDFSEVAKCFGFKYRKIISNVELTSNVSSVLETSGPVLCEIYGKEDQDYITTSHARNKKGRFVYRPIEDQYPFMDRKLFLNEMIVDPIDQ
tara:strand:- start:19124 stop:20845 length:1722 start_codon:yes stop_codon:yes gene_type:complete